MPLKIAYLHGLEAKQGGPKVEYLEEKGYEVYAPALAYMSHPQVFQELYRYLQDFRPDYIIGSSMGGYFAYHLCRLLDSKGILLNPALSAQSIGIEVDDTGTFTPDLYVFMGKNDELIPPAQTEKFLKNKYTGFVVTVQNDYGHRTPYEAFVQVVDTVLGEER